MSYAFASRVKLQEVPKKLNNQDKLLSGGWVDKIAHQAASGIWEGIIV